MKYLLTKQQRFLIYTTALSIYKNSIVDNRNRGICRAIRDAINEVATGINRFDITPYHHMEQYPEIARQKPASARNDYWWPVCDISSRIAVFEKAIKATSSPLNIDEKPLTPAKKSRDKWA